MFKMGLRNLWEHCDSNLPYSYMHALWFSTPIQALWESVSDLSVWLDVSINAYCFMSLHPPPPLIIFFPFPYPPFSPFFVPFFLVVVVGGFSLNYYSGLCQYKLCESEDPQHHVLKYVQLQGLSVLILLLSGWTDKLKK